MGSRSVALAGLAAAVATVIFSAQAPSPEAGGWLRVLFVLCWLAAALAVAHWGESGAVTVVTVAFLISFPMGFTGMSAGLPVVDQAWRTVGSISLVAFLYLFPRGQFEPRWTTVSFAGSAAYVAARAFFPQVAGWPGDLVIFPLIMVLPLGLQVVRYRSASNPIDRHRLRIVALASAVALVGQMILFGLLSAGWLGPAIAAEFFVEPVAYLLALLLPAGITLALVPLGGRVRRLTNHVSHSGDDAVALIAQLNQLAQNSIASRDLLPLASEAIRRSLHLRAVSITIADLDDPAFEGMSATSPDWSRALTHHGVLIGLLRVRPRRGSELSAGDREILRQLSVQLASIVGAVHLAEQLEEARTRLLNVREEERRRLRAELHDELGATLAGLTLKTGLARSLLGQEPERTRRLLCEIEANLKASVSQIRGLIEGLRPAQLDELGLDAAISEMAERFVESGSAMSIRISGHAQPGLPAAVELAAYRIAQEALTNAVRHSEGSLVDVRLAVEDDEHLLTLQVADNGVGLRDTTPVGFGIQTMRQRAREVGGDCTLRPGRTGGVVVTATLPLLTEGNG